MNIKDLIIAEKKSGVNLREIARRSGVSMGTIQNILLGDTDPYFLQFWTQWDTFIRHPVDTFRKPATGGCEP